MTADDAPREIPPLDDAPDIARGVEPQPGEELAEPRNWPGYLLLLAAAVFALAAAAASGWGFGPVALAATILAVVALLAGAGLVVLERLRRRAVGRQERARGSAPAWQTIVPPRD